MRELYLNRAIAEAVIKEMERDPHVILMGEDIINKGGGMSIFMGTYDKFPERCLDMPISESGFTHFANGAATVGLRPVVDLMFSDFASVPFDAIVNTAAKISFISQGEAQCPTVYVMGNGGRGTYGGPGMGCNHSQCTEGWFINVPGLKIVMPYYPADALGLLRAAIRDNDPVIFMYHQGSLGLRGPVPDEDYIIPLNNAAKVIRKGSDVTVVAIQSMLPLAVKAAAQLEELGISAELIDPRVIVPLDREKIINSVKKTGRLLVVQEAHSRGGIGSEIISIVARECIGGLKAVNLLGALNSPIGSSFTEACLMPHVEDIVQAVQEFFK
jgi:pyruvate/2-oxoglutarate/acetoin dehydrogenase E1 component